MAAIRKEIWPRRATAVGRKSNPVAARVAASLPVLPSCCCGCPSRTARKGFRTRRAGRHACNAAKSSAALCPGTSAWTKGKGPGLDDNSHSARQTSLPANLPRRQSAAHRDRHLASEMFVDGWAPWNQCESDSVIQHGESTADQLLGSTVYAADGLTFHDEIDPGQ